MFVCPYKASIHAAAATAASLFSGNSSLLGPNNEVTFSFVGRKGPKGFDASKAPFRVAPPANLFLNNHFCWPLLRPSQDGAAGGSPGDGRAASLSVNQSSNIIPAFGQDGSPTPAAAAGGSGVSNSSDGSSQQQWPAIAVPQLPPDVMPRSLMVEYLPVAFNGGEDSGLFAKNLTQFYIK